MPNHTFHHIIPEPGTNIGNFVKRGASAGSGGVVVSGYVVMTVVIGRGGVVLSDDFVSLVFIHSFVAFEAVLERSCQRIIGIFQHVHNWLRVTDSYDTMEGKCWCS